MEKKLKSILIFISLSLFLIFFISYYSRDSHAEDWKRMVDNGFGNPRNDYAWSMETFKGKLYVGLLNFWGGGEIWCTETGETGEWNMAYESRANNNSGIRCLYADENQFLYACTSSKSGASILRTEDGDTWNVVAKNGFGDRKNDTIRCMTRFKEYLYVGVGSEVAKLYRSKDGLQWEEVKDTGFDTTKVPNKNNRMVYNNVMIGELSIFNDYLYAFTWTKDLDLRAMRWIITRTKKQNFKTNLEHNADKSEEGEEDSTEEELSFLPSSAGAFEVWRSSDGAAWEKVVGQDDAYGNGMGFSGHDPKNIDNDVAISANVFKGQLYLGTEHDYGKTAIWRTSDGTTWEKTLDFYESGEKFNYYVWRLKTFQDKLYVGTLNMGSMREEGVTGGQIWASDSGDPGTFYNLVHNGFDGETVTISYSVKIPKNYGIRSFGILNDTLFAGTATVMDMFVKSGRSKKVGCEIWKMIP